MIPFFEDVKSYVLSLIGAATATDDTVRGKINTMSTKLNAGMVKSVQRGVNNGFPSADDITIPISNINPAKSSVTIYFSRAGGSVAYNKPVIVQLNTNSLVVTFSAAVAAGPAYTGQKFSWEIVEFY